MLRTFVVGALTAPDQPGAQIARPYQRQHERRQERHAHRDGKGAEERARYFRDGDQREEDDDRRQRRSDERNGQFLQGAGRGFQRTLPRIPVQHDIFDDDDLVIDHKADGRGEPTQCHQVETLAH